MFSFDCDRLQRASRHPGEEAIGFDQHNLLVTGGWR